MPLDLTPQKPPYYEIATSEAGSQQYIAKLSQTGTAAPTATIIKDTLNTPITWSRTSAGVYQSQVISGAFPLNKTTLLITPYLPINNVGMQHSADQVGIYSGVPVEDDVLDNTTVIITIYP